MSRYSIFERTPNSAVEYIKELIKDKVVFDVGAGDGSFAKEMQKYAKKVVAVEEDRSLWIYLIDGGLESINDDFMNVPLTDAEVIFVFMSFTGNYALTQKLKEEDWHGMVISHYYPLQETPVDWIKPDKVIDVNTDGVRFPLLIYNL